MNTAKPLNALFAMAILIGFAGCAKEHKQERAERPMLVKAHALLGPGQVRVVEFPGQINPIQQSVKAFEVDGHVIELLVKEGQQIKEGDLLARLDPTDFIAARDAARARYDLAVLNADRHETLYTRNSISKQDLDISMRDLKTAQSELSMTEKALQDTRMVADFDGVVAEIIIEDYANIVAKQKILVIQDISQFEISVHVPESIMVIPVEGDSDAEKVARTQPVVIPSVLPDSAFPARFSEVSSVPDPDTRTYRFTLVFDPPKEHSLNPGMTAKVRAHIPPNNLTDSSGFSVPMHAVFADTKGQARVWRIDPKTQRVASVPVETGTAASDTVVINGNLSSGDLLVVSGVHHLNEASLVKVWQR